MEAYTVSYEFGRVNFHFVLFGIARAHVYGDFAEDRRMGECATNV